MPPILPKDKKKKRRKSFDEEKLTFGKFKDLISSEELYFNPYENCMILKLPAQTPPEVHEVEGIYGGYYSFLNGKESTLSHRKDSD